MTVSPGLYTHTHTHMCISKFGKFFDKSPVYLRHTFYKALYAQYSPSLSLSFYLLSDSLRLPAVLRRNAIIIDPFWDFFNFAERLICKICLHRTESVLIRSGLHWTRLDWPGLATTFVIRNA